MSSLNPYNQVLGLRKAKHLLRRATFSYRKSDLDALAAMTATQAVNYLSNSLTGPLTEPYDPEPTSSPDGLWTSSTNAPGSFSGQGRKRIAITGWWWYNALNQPSLKHKLTFFLHTSFTVSKDDGAGAATHFYDHLRLLEFYATGNLKTLAKKITLDNSMLQYLDNTQNNANNPNENYAREFLELFTILKGPQISDGDYTNYTEIDVQMAAKVFSGFKTKTDRSVLDTDTNIPRGIAVPNKHDANNKTFSAHFGGQTITGQSTEAGMLTELSDFVDMVFARQATAISYCRKLYRYFVKSEWDTTVENNVILPLAQDLIANNYEILPIVQKLLASNHFYDEDNTDSSDEIIGSIVKTPLQLVSEVCSLFNISLPDPTPSASPLEYYRNFFRKFIHNSFLGSAGMGLYAPDSVAGYPASYQEPNFDRHWFVSNTIISRYKMINSLIAGTNTIGTGTISSQIDSVTFVKNNISNPSNSDTVVTELANLLYPESISQDRITHFTNILLDGFNSYYWTSAWNNYITSNDSTTVKLRLDDLLIAMINAAEFQLM